MEKGYITVGQFLDAFNWSDIDFEINQITRAAFLNSGGAEVDYEPVFDSRVDKWDKVNQYRDMRILDIIGSIYHNGYSNEPLLRLIEDVWQYEEIAKKNEDWVYSIS